MKRQTQPETKTRFSKIVALLAVVATFLIGAQLFLSNYLATQGGKLAGIEAEIVRLEQENRDLKTKISTAGSVNFILENALALGFEKPTKFFFVKQNLALSQK